MKKMTREITAMMVENRKCASSVRQSVGWAGWVHCSSNTPTTIFWNNI